MHQLLYFDFWIYVVFIVILFGAVFYLPPVLMSFLNKVFGSEKADAKKCEPGEAAETDKRRYKTF